VPRKRPGGSPLFATRWVHAYEEDSAQGEVYRPAGADLPLSRRPREQLQLREDGSASLFAGGPDDRPVVTDAVWKREGELIVVHLRGSRRGPVLRIVEEAPDRLIVKRWT
jgi:hypothetical protein